MVTHGFTARLPPFAVVLMLAALPATAGGGGISGTVTEDGSGLPLDSITVEVYTETGSFTAFDFTDGSGGYGFGGLAPGTYFVRTSQFDDPHLDELYDDLPCVGNCDPLAGTPIAATPPMVIAGIDFALTPGGRIGGTVTDQQDGSGIAGYVFIYDAGGEFAGYGLSGGTTGSYLSLSGLPDGDYYAVTLNLEGYQDELYDDVPCPGCMLSEGTPIAVTVPATSTADFQLVDPIFSDGFESGDLSAWSQAVPRNAEAMHRSR